MNRVIISCDDIIMTEVITCRLHQNGVLKKAIFEFMRDLLKAEGDNLKKITLIDLFVLLKDDKKPKNMSSARERISDAAFNINLKKQLVGFTYPRLSVPKTGTKRTKKRNCFFTILQMMGLYCMTLTIDDRGKAAANPITTYK